MPCFKAKVVGTVQGVGFRYFVRHYARTLNVKGYVKNFYDGSVEVVGEGNQENLDKLIRLLQEGPALSKVTQVSVEWLSDIKSFQNFDIEF